MVEISKTLDREIAHFLTPYDGACENMHGHTYEVTCTITSPEGLVDADNLNIMMDYKELKKIMEEIIPDHCVVLDKEAQADFIDFFTNQGKKVYVFDGMTTAENMVKEFGRLLNEMIMEKTDEKIMLKSFSMKETRNSNATWTNPDFIYVMFARMLGEMAQEEDENVESQDNV